MSQFDVNGFKLLIVLKKAGLDFYGEDDCD